MLKQLGYGVLVMILLGYIGKLIIPYFIQSLKDKDKRINELVDGFQKTTDKFTETINNFTEVMNHKSSEHTEAIINLGKSMENNTKLIIKSLKYEKKTKDNRKKID